MCEAIVIEDMFMSAECLREKHRITSYGSLNSHFTTGLTELNILFLGGGGTEIQMDLVPLPWTGIGSRQAPPG